MLKDNEFVLSDEKGQKLCKAVATIYFNESQRGFVVYDDGTKNNATTLLKIGEIVQDEDEILVEQVTDKDIIDQVWKEFEKLCESHR